jgi:hypothetical protein
MPSARHATRGTASDCSFSWRGLEKVDRQAHDGQRRQLHEGVCDEAVVGGMAGTEDHQRLTTPASSPRVDGLASGLEEA